MEHSREIEQLRSTLKNEMWEVKNSLQSLNSKIGELHDKIDYLKNLTEDVHQMINSMR